MSSYDTFVNSDWKYNFCHMTIIFMEKNFPVCYPIISIKSKKVYLIPKNNYGAFISEIGIFQNFPFTPPTEKMTTSS